MNHFDSHARTPNTPQGCASRTLGRGIVRESPSESPSNWLMEFRPEGQGPPAAIRVRRLLKAALRAYGLRCVTVYPAGVIPPVSAAKASEPVQDNDIEVF